MAEYSDDELMNLIQRAYGRGWVARGKMERPVDNHKEYTHILELWKWRVDIRRRPSIPIKEFFKKILRNK